MQSSDTGRKTRDEGCFLVGWCYCHQGGGGYNTKHVAKNKYFRRVSTSNCTLDGVINLKGKEEKCINNNEECRGAESRPRIRRQDTAENKQTA